MKTSTLIVAALAVAGIATPTPNRSTAQPPPALSVEAAEVPAEPPVAIVTTSHDVIGEDGAPTGEIRPFEVSERIRIDASKSTGTDFYTWSVFADFDVIPPHQRARVPASVRAAIAHAEAHGAVLTVPVVESDVVAEYNPPAQDPNAGGTVLDITPIPGTFYVSFVASGDGGKPDLRQLVIRVHPYPADDDGGTDPDPDPSEYDFTPYVSGWLASVPAEHHHHRGDLGTWIVERVANREAFDSHELVEAYLQGAWDIVIDDPDAIDGWKSFMDQFRDQRRTVWDESTLDQYKSAVRSVGDELRETDDAD